jgi:hypothetical protein
MRLTPTASALLLLVLVACSAEPVETRPLGMEADGGTLHPQAQYLPYRDFPRTNLVLNDSSAMGDALDRFLTTSEDGIRVGVDSTAPFGEVRAVLAVGDALGVFDPHQLGLHIVTREGVLRSTVGRSGNGPGEFRRPTAVLSPHPDTLLIADVMHRVEVFTRDATDDSWRVFRTVKLDFSVKDICRLGDRYYAYGYAAPGAGGPVRELDGNLTVVRQFGEAYASPHEGINQTMTEYALVCEPSSARLVIAPTAGIGELIVMGVTGEVERILHWSDFASFRIEELPDGVAVGQGARGLNRIRTIAPLGDGLVLVQYDWVSTADLKAKQDFTVLHSLAIDIRMGEVVARTTALPPISVIDDRTYAVHLSEPWPGVLLLTTGR